MNLKNSVLSDIYKELSLSSEEFNFLASKFEEITLDKNEILIQENSTVYYQYYVIEGCLRSFLVDDNGKEHTLQFAINDWWISDYTAFFSESKAMLSIKSVHKSTILRVSRKNMEDLYEKIPQVAHFNRIKLEKAYSALQKRILANLSMTAKERYISFINSYPNIEQSVKNYHIASFLGITTESLSRIRKELTKR